MSRFEVKVYESFNSEEPDLISVYDSETMMYTGLFTREDLGDCERVCGLLNSLDDELKHADGELATLREYMGRSKHDLMKENIKLKAGINYEKGVFELEKKYYRECLLTLIEEYPRSSGLLAFKDLMGW